MLQSKACFTLTNKLKHGLFPYLKTANQEPFCNDSRRAYQIETSDRAIRTYEVVSPNRLESAKLYRRKRRPANELREFGFLELSTGLPTLRPGRKRITRSKASGNSDSALKSCILP